jgi:hypothetical protein
MIIPGCGGGHNSTLATRRADFRNIENIVGSTSAQCRTAVGALSDAVNAALARSGSTAILEQSAKAVSSACTKSTDEEIQDLETLTVPVDLRDLRLEQATSNLTAWCADAAAVGRDVIRLVQNHADAAAANEFNAKVTDMRQVAQSALGTLSAAAVALKVEATPIDLRTVGPLPG